MVVNLVLPWRLTHITSPGRNPLLPIHQYFHLQFGNIIRARVWVKCRENYWQICWRTFPRCGIVGFPFDPGSVRLHLMLPFVSLLVSWDQVYTSLVHSNELSWNALQLNSNSNVSMIRSFLIGGVEYGWIPAKAFARERMTCPVPSVKLTRQVQRAVRWKKNVRITSIWRSKKLKGGEQDLQENCKSVSLSSWSPFQPGNGAIVGNLEWGKLHQKNLSR